MPKPTLLAAILFSLTAFVAASAAAQSPATNTDAGSEPLGVALEGWPYPYPLQTFQFDLEGQSVRMMYMDVHPANPNGNTVLLFHGKNFGADYWSNTLRALSDQGYRVIAPDQIGFGKSSKPEIRYNFEPVSYTHLRAHETRHDLVCRLL